MCGRYTVTAAAEELERRFDATLDGEFHPRYNAAPGQALPVITNEEPGAIRFLRWGLVPPWADDDSGGLINARAETVAEKPSFAPAYEARRCLVLVDGFYERVAEGSERRPYRVTLDDGEPFAVAGLRERWTPTSKQTGLDEFGAGRTARWSRWRRSPSSPRSRTTSSSVWKSLLTSGRNVPARSVSSVPNATIVADLHHRMAVILPERAETEWLTAEDPRHLLEPFPADRMRAYRVSTAVNDPSNDSPELIEPVD